MIGVIQPIADAHADYFSRQSSPNVLLTTSYKPSKLMFHFLADMLEVLPCAQFFKRQVYGCAIPTSDAVKLPYVAFL